MGTLFDERILAPSHLFLGSLSGRVDGFDRQLLVRPWVHKNCWAVIRSIEDFCFALDCVCVTGQSCRLGTAVTTRWARSGCGRHRSAVVASPPPFDSPSTKPESCVAAARMVKGPVEWRWDVLCLGCSRWPAPTRLCLADQRVPPYSACLASRRLGTPLGMGHAILLHDTPCPLPSRHLCTHADAGSSVETA
jgi:hypothetical protein